MGSSYILKETRKALCGKLKLSPQHADEIVSALRGAATIMQPTKVPTSACRDETDLPILGTLLSGSAQCLITGDQDLLERKEFRGIPIFSPRVFHDRLRA